MKLKYHDGSIGDTKLVFKKQYRDEYTNEELPMGFVWSAMLEELAYFCDRVWEGVPLAEAGSTAKRMMPTIQT